MVQTRPTSVPAHLRTHEYLRQGQCPPIPKPRAVDVPVILLPVARPNAGEHPTCVEGARALKARH